MFSQENIPSTKLVLSAAASIATSAMLVRTILNDFLPYEVQDYVFSSLRSITSRFSSELTIVIEELDTNSLSANKIYEAAGAYLGSKVNKSTRRLKVCKVEEEKKFIVTIDKNEEVIDDFQGLKLKWRFACISLQSSFLGSDQQKTFQERAYELSFHKKHKQTVLDIYLPYLLNEFKAIKEASKGTKLYTVDEEYGRYSWKSVNLNHPSTFDTIAMDLDKKNELIADLDKFIERKDMYKRIGKAWKRGYLFYGPPGTGKSSLIAAMANYLNFDIYDMDLTDIHSNSDFRKVLLSTSNQSILVLEDIDCTIKLEKREEKKEDIDKYYKDENKVTLSGLLNFIDGLWSSCGDERIIIFTTNHKEKLDPALLRPGRMDMHIHMSYCTPGGFKVLAYNYLGIHDHPLFKEIVELIEKVETTPAEVAGELMKSDDIDISLCSLIKFLKEVMTNNEIDTSS